jgi:moderate conductance mechanosensitive channel
VARDVLSRVATELSAEDDWSTRISGLPDDQGVQALTTEGVTLRLVIETEPASQWAVERELRLRIKEAFDEAGVRLAMGVTAPPPAA